VAVLRLNKALDAFHIPVLLILRPGGLAEVYWAVIEKTRSGVRDDEGSVTFEHPRLNEEGILPGEGNAASGNRPNLSNVQ
jgi:hypothetical protein